MFQSLVLLNYLNTHLGSIQSFLNKHRRQISLSLLLFLKWSSCDEGSVWSRWGDAREELESSVAWSHASSDAWVRSFSLAAVWHWSTGTQSQDLKPIALIRGSPPWLSLIPGKRKRLLCLSLTAQGCLIDFIFLGCKHGSLLSTFLPCCSRVCLPFLCYHRWSGFGSTAWWGVSGGSNRPHRRRMQVLKAPLGPRWPLVRLGLFRWRIPI